MARKLPKRGRPSKANDNDALLAAARRLREHLHHYIEGGYVRDAVEPLLRYYLKTYEPEARRKEAELRYSLASAAWQVLLRRPAGQEIQRAWQGVARIRRKYDAADAWPLNRDGVERVITSALKPGRMEELTRARRLWECFGEGLLGRGGDRRRGVRPEVAELLIEAKASALMHVTGAQTVTWTSNGPEVVT